MNIERIKKVKSAKVFTAADVAVVVILVAIAAAAIIAFTAKKADVAVVSVDGRKTEYSLQKTETIDLDCLTVHIDGGKVWVTNSTCLDHTCEKSGKISSPGQSIVCLPNKIVITVSGESDLQWEVGK